MYQHSSSGAPGDNAAPQDRDDARYDVTTLQQFSTGTAPKFPTDALPRSVARLVREGAAAIGCPEDFIGLAALTAMGAAIGNSRVIQPKKDWTEGAALYSAVIGESGDKKTAAVAVATNPTLRLEHRLNKDYESKLEAHAAEEREQQARNRDHRKEGRAEEAMPKSPDAQRVHINDATIEAVIPILKANPRGVLLERDELVGWVKSMDQYKAGGKGGERQIWLSTWSNRPVSVDRKAQEGQPLSVLRPFVGVLGSIQPTVLSELAEGREDGMLERFLFAYPKPLNALWTEDEISEAAEVGYADLHNRLRNLHLPTDELGDPIEKPVAFSPEAKQAFIDSYNVHRQEMAAPDFPSYLRSPWSKLEAYLVRLTLIVAACRFVEDGAPERIEDGDVLRAVALLDYFKNQARRVFGALREADPVMPLMRDVVAFLKPHGGVWVGEPSELHAQLESAHKPERPNELSKYLKKGADKVGLLITTDVENRQDEETGKWHTRRVLTLYLPQTS